MKKAELDKLLAKIAALKDAEKDFKELRDNIPQSTREKLNKSAQAVLDKHDKAIN